MLPIAPEMGKCYSRLLTVRLRIGNALYYGHWKLNRHNEIRVFDAYFRKLPFENGYAVFAGLERIVQYINFLHFTDEQIAYLRTQPENYEEAFLTELKAFRFTGTLSAMKEGTVVFPNEPLIRVEARLFEIQLIETAVLNFMNFQTLIATKASRIRQVAPDATLLEMGSRRAQEADAAIWGARSAFIGGFDGTSNLEAGKRFNIPAMGTQAHAWIMDFDSELEAFRAYASIFPHQTSLLVDTYDTLKSGVPNAIIVAKELEEKGHRLHAIRLDSGDLASLSQRARKMLDEAGLSYVKIIASNDLDEKIIFHLQTQGAKIDAWGVGTQLITAADQPSLGGVYKLVAKKEKNQYTPVIKVSENPEKVTTPGKKEVYRIINNETKKAEADYITFYDEVIDETKPLALFDPINTWKTKTVKNFTAVKLLQPIFIEGQCVYTLPTLQAIKTYHTEQLTLLWAEHLRKMNPQDYYVDLSESLWSKKMNLLSERK